MAPNGGGNITFEEFAECMIETADEDVPSDDIKRAFAAFDKDGSGYICPEDLQKMMLSIGEFVSHAEALEMIKDADTNSDGKISYAEFEAVINAVG